METNYKVIKLLNGTIVVGNALFSPEDILIQYPLEVYTKPVHDESGKLVGEQMVLRPCLVMTKESEVVIDTYNVLYSSDLDDRLYESYEQMVKTVYKKKVYFEGNFYKDEDIKEDLTVEEAEYMKEVLDGLLDKDKTYH
jgi:hypothetical protein